MAQRGRELVKAFAELCGLNPAQVTSLQLVADAQIGVLEAHVDLFPELTPEQLAAFQAQLKEFGAQLVVHVEAKDE